MCKLEQTESGYDYTLITELRITSNGYVFSRRHKTNITFFITPNILNNWSRIHLVKPIITHLVKEFLAFYVIWRFTILFKESTTSTVLSWTNLIHIATPYFLRCILILPPHLISLHIPFILILTKFLYAFLTSPMHATCSWTHVTWIF